MEGSGRGLILPHIFLWKFKKTKGTSITVDLVEIRKGHLSVQVRNDIA
jgi:hypothetical protein